MSKGFVYQVGELQMPRFSHRSTFTLCAVVIAAAHTSHSVYAQGDFVIQDQVSRVIDLQRPSNSIMGTDLEMPPHPRGLELPATRTIDPVDVDFEVIDANGDSAYNNRSNAPTVTDFVRRNSGVNPPSIQRVEAQEPRAAIETTMAATASTAMADSTDLRNRAASTPIITVEIDSSQEVNVDEDTNVYIRLRNAGSENVETVGFTMDMPKHAAFVSAKPSPVTNIDGKLYFELSNLAANHERKIAIQVTATEKLPLNFRTKTQIIDTQNMVVSVRQPKLIMKVDGPKQINIGQETTHIVTIENVGDGTAKQVRLQGSFPDELRFLKQHGMTAPKNLRPGENLIVTIQSLAKLPGQVKLDFVAEGKGVAADPAGSPLKISQPELNVVAIGPNLNFVDRDGIYSIKVDNSGEVDVTDVSVRLNIPHGMKVTTINRQAKMDENQQSLTWTFDNIRARSNEMIQLKAISSKPGEQICRISVGSNETQQSNFTLKTAIASRADLSIDMANNSGPVQIGAKAVFDVTVVNKGSQAADNVEVTVELPPTLMALAKDNVGVTVNEATNSISFNSSQVQPGKELTFKFNAIGVAKGEHVVRSALKAQGSQKRVIVEESVYVYETNESRISENLTPVFPR